MQDTIRHSPVEPGQTVADGAVARKPPAGCSQTAAIYDPCSCSRPRRSLGSPNGTFQMSRAYSLMARSEENHAMRAILSMLVRVQLNVDSQSPSTLLCVAK